ncbi:hypothetical protein VNI00_008493 [Paramarasmius palmivorus]|uniref:Cytochrome P450 n=1 Tax=Paramarasmius palmivorus TaxID=297713 RepID=A0AAW0CY41_9AGAR
MTFSAGVRGCLGWRFAVHEIQTVATLLLESFKFAMPADVDITMVDAALVAPVVKGRFKEGIQMPLKLELRE